MLWIGRRFDEPRHLLSTEDLGKALRLLGRRNLEGQPVAPERRVVEKTEGARRDVARAPRQVPRRHHVLEESLNLFHRDLVG